MAFSKAHRFDQSDYHYSLLCRALSHPARLTIVRKLYNDGPSSVKALLEGMQISRPSMSQHLQILREMQIVQCEQKPPTVIYWLNTELPNTYNCVIDLLLRAGVTFEVTHANEIDTISRIAKATALGI